MDDKKIACITCVTDDAEYNELKFYLERQKLPLGYELEFIDVRGASSMAAGYNLAVKTSDAKYKVYLHQDAFVVNPCALAQIIEIFVDNPTIGLIGVVGVADLLAANLQTMDYNRGHIHHNSNPHDLLFERPINIERYALCDTVDGVFIMTQYDLPWREDIFCGWDFYDASICREYINAGYKVAVPYQENPFVYHDNTYSNMLSYYAQKEIYVREYFGMECEMTASAKRALEFAGVQKQALKTITDVASSGDRESLYEIFSNDEFRGFAHLRELEAIADIDYLEKKTGSELDLWPVQARYDEALESLRRLKRLVKRLEYVTKNITENEDMLVSIGSEFSPYAILEVVEKYVIDKNRILALFPNVVAVLES